MLAVRTIGLGKTFRVKRKAPGLKGSLRSLWSPEWEEKQAVQGLDLSIANGETVAFLGPNGAGKSTTIKMLTGILHPSRGTAEVLGLSPWSRRGELAYRIGAVFGQKSQLWYHLPPQDTFELIGRVYELGREDYRRRSRELIERFELGPYLQTPVRKLSLGERMRCEIAAAFLHRPLLLLLDEPTIGLDVVVKQRIRELIRERNRSEGTTVLLTSHDPTDVEELCSRVVVIHHGGLLLDLPVERMKRGFLNRKTIRLTTSSPAAACELPLPAGAAIVREEGRSLIVEADLGRTTVEEVLRGWIGQVGIEDLTIEDPPLEETIKQIYRSRSPQEGDA